MTNDWLLPADAAQAFLRDHWQRAPLFLPAALRDVPQRYDWQALATSEDAEARRVVTTPEGGYRLEHGPFEAAQLDTAASGSATAMPWTVLIQDADQHDARLRALMARFGFLPGWRLEDVMLSYATPGGSVGPHVDAYDVFLVQAAGERRWQVGAPGSAVEAQQHDDGLRLVAPFVSTLDVVAQPGDVLYLPPGVPHHGVAQSACVTLSVGFRAPSFAELAAALLEGTTSDARYTDPPLTPATQPALIDAQAVAAARRLLWDGIDLSAAHVARTLGRVVTEPKDWFLPEPPAAPVDDAELRLRLAAATGALRLTAGSRVALTRAPAMLFVNGEALPLSPSCQALADVLARERELADTALTAAAGDADAVRLLARLIDSGALYWRDEIQRQ